MSRAVAEPYPQDGAGRDRWILSRRNGRAAVDPWRPVGFFVEDERTENGDVAQVATVLLANRECPWRCVMCDLWRNTLTETVPPGAIPAQIDYALAQLPPARQVKLYNSGSFFDPRAIPPDDYQAIAHSLSSFERVIVECHPALIGDRCWEFRDLLSGRMEVAMGLETAHPLALERLNKRMTLADFAAASNLLAERGVALRVFVLSNPPFVDVSEAALWTERSIDFAMDCGATVVSIVPTRLGNGALDALEQGGHFAPPTLGLLESALAYGIGQRRARVFADLWDLHLLAECERCFSARRERLRQMNLAQTLLAGVPCEYCGG